MSQQRNILATNLRALTDHEVEVIEAALELLATSRSDKAYVYPCKICGKPGPDGRWRGFHLTKRFQHDYYTGD